MNGITNGGTGATIEVQLKSAVGHSETHANNPKVTGMPVGEVKNRELSFEGRPS